MNERFKEIKKITNNPFLNYYELSVTNKAGKEHPYYMASRAKDGLIKAQKGEYPSDGILIYGVHQGEDQVDRLVLVRQFRYPIGDYVYELPAGLIDPGESETEAAVREYREETGLTLKPLMVEEALTKGFYSSAGMTDESVGTAYGYAYGIPSTKELEENEDLSVILADREEVKRILREGKFCSKTGYLMLLFLNSKNGKPFDFLENFLK